MKKRILSLLLFLLTTLWAAASTEVKFHWDGYRYASLTLGSENVKTAKPTDGSRPSIFFRWDASTKVLEIDNAFFDDLEISGDSNEKLTLDFSGDRPYLGKVKLNKPGDIEFTTLSHPKAFSIEFLKSSTRLILEDPSMEIYKIIGTNDNTSRILIKNTHRSILANCWDNKLVIEHAEECSGISSIDYANGIGFVKPHGGYVYGGIIKDASGKKCSGTVEIGLVKSYGFSLGGTEVTEANYDLLDKPTRYFPGVKGQVKYVPEENTLYMNGTVVDGDIVNNENANLRINISGGCIAKNLSVDSNTKLMGGAGNVDYLSTTSVSIGRKTRLYCFTNLRTYSMQGYSTSDASEMSRLCLENPSAKLYGTLDFQRGDAKNGMMKNVRLTDIVDNDSRITFSTWHKTDGNYCYFSKGLLYGKMTSGPNAGHYGIYEKGGTDFYAPTGNYDGLTFDAHQTIYPLKVGGVQVTEANMYCIDSPAIEYAPDGDVYSTMSYDRVTNTLYIDGANIKASAGIPAIEYTGRSDLKINVGRNDFLKEQNLIPGTKVDSRKLTSTITCSDETPALVSSENTFIEWGQMTVNSQNSSSMNCGAFNIAGKMVFTKETNVTVPVVSAKELKASMGSYVNITKGLAGSNTSFGENTYKAALSNCDVQASADAYYEPDNQYIYATGAVSIVPYSKATKYPFWVFGRQVTSTNCGYVSGSYLKSGSLKFNPSTNIFEMRDAQIDYSSGSEPFIKTKDRALNLMLYGNNAVNCSAEAIVADGDDLNIMGGKCGLTLKPATSTSKAASVQLANEAAMSVYASDPSFVFQRIADDGTCTLEVSSPMTVNGNGYDPTIKVKKIELDEEVELLNTLDRPQKMGEGTVLNSNNKPTTGTVEFVPKGTSPIYPTSIEIENPTITFAKLYDTDRIRAKVLPEDATDPTLTWTSSDYNVVQVGTDGFVKAVKNGTATITARAINGVKATATVTVAIPDPVSITLSETEHWFKDASYNNFFLEATIENEDADQTIEWSSDDKSVVTVTPYGKTCRVERVADEGETVVRAKTVNGLEETCKVRIHYPKMVESIKLSENEVRFTEIGREQVVVMEWAPSDAEDLGYLIDVRGGDPEVADVETRSNGTLVITSKKEGTLGIAVWATCDEAPVTYDYLSITVKPTVLATGVTVQNPTGQDAKFYAFDEQMQLIATVTPYDVDNSKVTWTSSDPSVATVDENGVVTSKGVGSTMIKATTTDGTNLSGQLRVEVLNPADWAIVPANGVTLSRRELILFPDQRFEMTAELAPQFANTYVDWEVEEVSGDGGSVEVSPGNWSDGYDAQPSESRWADVSAYVPIKDEATFPIVAKIIVKVRDYEGEVQPTDTCIVTIMDDIYFTEANAEGIDINYHVISGDPENPQCEIYAKKVMKHDEYGYYESTEPAIDGELTGKLIVPSTANGYWVTTVGKNAFSRSKIEEVELPEGLTTVAAGAFAPNVGFEKLQAVTLPSTLKYLGNGAFTGQWNLKKVTIDSEEVPEAIDDSGNTGGMLSDCFNGIAGDAVLYVPYGCIDLYSDMTWLQWFANIEDGSYLTQNTEEGVAMSFHISSMAELTAEVKGKRINEMENELAVDANATVVTIPSMVEGYKVTSISEYAFVNHGNQEIRSKMEQVFIPETVEKIDGSAFEACVDLKEVTIYRETAPEVTSAFNTLDPMAAQQRTLYVPFGCKEQYDVNPWNTWFGTIEEMPSPDYLPDTDISKIANVIYAAGVKANAGETAMLSIRMKSAAPIHAFQFRLTLPDGVDPVKMGKNKYMATLNTERMPEDAEHMLTFAKQQDGTIMFLCSILSEGDFAAGDGEIISMPVNVSEGMEDGEYPIVLQQIKLTESNVANYYETSSVKSTMTIGEGGEVHYVLGDATGDGVVDVSDYTIVANQILNSSEDQPSSARLRAGAIAGFNAAAADVNGDSQVDVSDYTGVANIILFGGMNGAKSARRANSMVKASDLSDVENLIYVKDFTIGDGNMGEMELPISMKCEASIRSFQFDLYLPEGMEAVKTSKGKFTTAWNTDRLPADDEHTLSLAQQADGAIRVLCGSLYDETFEGEDGVLFTLKVKVSGMADGAYTIALKDIKLSETDITKFYETSLYEAVMAIDTEDSIDGIKSDDLNDAVIYDLQGRRVKNSTKGIYIVNGKKVVIK